MYIFLGKIISLSLRLIKKTDKQKTKAILDIFEPIELPTARTVSFWSADSMDINISGADVREVSRAIGRDSRIGSKFLDLLQGLEATLT